MEFRPCIDIHNGKVKQIVGGTLKDQNDQAAENFVSEQDAPFYAQLYKRYGISGGHIILLNARDSSYYEATKLQALAALQVYPGGLQVGGGITAENAHVGKEHLVLDLSCRKKDGAYYIVTDRWQKFTDECVTEELLDRLQGYADEFLIHAVDVEGKASGIECGLVELLGNWNKIPVTYAGGIGSFENLKELSEYGKHHLNYTIGSALDLFGGSMKFEDVLEFGKKFEI